MSIRILSAIVAVFLASASVNAQIGYQVAVMDETKGEPKANTSVAVSVTLSDNAGKVICSESHTETTDDFGIISMQIGNAETFDNADWSKLPFWITASVDGVTISKTQVLSVPVAEHAKHTGTLTLEKLCSKTWKGRYGTFSFHKDMKCSRGGYLNGTFTISDDKVMIRYTRGDTGYGKLLIYVEGAGLIDAYEKGVYK